MATVPNSQPERMSRAELIELLQVERHQPLPQPRYLRDDPETQAHRQDVLADAVDAFESEHSSPRSSRDRLAYVKGGAA